MADLEALWGKLQHASLLKKHLDQSLYNSLKNVRTKYGGTLADCIRSGALNLQSGVGIYACDPDGYDKFSPILDKVIMDYHKVPRVEHPDPDFGDINNLGFGDLDKAGTMINSTRVRVGRSHAGYGFPPVCNLKQRLEMEEKTIAALKTLKGDLAGKYFPLAGMDKETEKQMIADHFLFKDDDKCLKDASGYDDWPYGRGIFFSNDKKFLVWVNEEDHLRLISMQKGGNLAEVYQRLVRAIQQLETKLTFAKTRKHGYLTYCPTNLGTTMRASVHIKIPKLSTSPHFKEFCDKYNLQARGIHGEHTESVGGVYDISNKRRLGLTEIQAITEMKNGVVAIMAEEKKLAGQAKK